MNLVQNLLNPSRLLRLAAALLFPLGVAIAAAQTAGEGAIQGTITDSTGASIPGAKVTVTNTATSVSTTQVSTSAGLYNVTPLIPGTYTVSVTAPGFETFNQQNLVVDALRSTGLNVVLKVGAQTEQVTVTEAPPQLDTTNATLGGTIKASEYMDLPLLVTGGQQRDITQFSNLLPGAQLNPAGRSSIIGGTQARLGEVYVDGLPMTTISQQGDNRPIFNAVPLESISEIQVVTSGFSAEYQGIGLENYTMRSGTNDFHGTAVDFIRNRIFDTWGFTNPWLSVIQNNNGVISSVYANTLGNRGKPVDHQNEFSASVGGPVIIPHLFNGRNKLFFEATYDRNHSRTPPITGTNTLPTTAMQQGNFSALLAANGGPGLTIYDPTTQASCTAHSTNGPCRYAFGQSAPAGTVTGPNGAPVGTVTNIIPANEVSPQAQNLQQFLPPLTNQNLTGNYVGAVPTGYDNYIWGGRVDWDISSRQRLSFVAADGRRVAYPYTQGTANLPVPYLAATLSSVVGNLESIEHSFTITPHLVNQFAVAYFYFGGPPVRNSTEGISKYEATTLGITNLPTGQASDEFPGVAFSGTDAQTNWQQPDITSKTVSHTFDIVDNVNWIKNKHSFTFGIQLQDLMENNSSFNTFSSPITLTTSPNDTANLTSNGTAYGTSTGGFSYASFLLGAVNTTSTNLQPFSDIGSRYHTIAPYVQDDFKVLPNLTVNIGLRWDYLPPFHEVLNRWTFLNANLTNPYTGNPGSLQFAGNYGGSPASCGCTTPVNTWYKNFGPRVGFSYSATSTTVIRGAVAVLYSHGGGTGGAGATATGQTGFSQPVSFPANPASPTAQPVFYLNNSQYFTTQGIANTAYGGAGYTYPSLPAASTATQLNTTQVGNFVNGAGAFVQSKAGISYADPYYGDRTPTVYFFNLGLQQAFTSWLTANLNYAGSISHFLSGASNLRGLQSGEINPIYLPLQSTVLPGKTTPANLLTAAATPANIALAQSILPGCCTAPYPGFTAAAQTTAGAAQATIGQGLKWMPQFSGTTDTWGAYSANAAYNALQASIAIRQYKGLTFNANYTWAKVIDDAGTQRTGYAIPANAIATGRAWNANRIDRAISTIDVPQILTAYGDWHLPFGSKGHLGGGNKWVSAFAGGWTFSSILTYSSGYPFQISSSSCTATTLPGQGTCMPDVNPAFTGPILSSKWKQNVTALTLGSHAYIREGLNGTAGYNQNTVPGSGGGTSAAPVACASSGAAFCNPGNGLIGDAPRTGAYGLRTPGLFRLASSVRRTFPIHEQVNFVFGVDCQNVTNTVQFGVNSGNSQIGAGINSGTFGTLGYASSDSRAFQLSGRFNF